MMDRLVPFLCFLVSCAAASAQNIKNVPHRADTQSYAVLQPEQQPRAVVLLYVGGEGTLNLESRRRISSMNVLYAIHGPLLKAGFRLIYADRPSGQFARADADYARAGATMIERENPERLPVFVAGISRGTISAVNVAARAPIAGLILLSTATFDTHDGTVRDAPVADVAAPALLLMHRRDACVGSNSTPALRAFAGDLKRAPATIVVLDGGIDEAPGKGRPAACHPLSYHGFNGIHDKVAETIIGWTQEHISPKTPPR